MCFKIRVETLKGRMPLLYNSVIVCIESKPKKGQMSSLYKELTCVGLRTWS